LWDGILLANLVRGRRRNQQGSQEETMEKDLITVVFERCCGLDIHKILPNRPYLPFEYFRELSVSFHGFAPVIT